MKIYQPVRAALYGSQAYEPLWLNVFKITLYILSHLHKVHNDTHVYWYNPIIWEMLINDFSHFGLQSIIKTSEKEADS